MTDSDRSFRTCARQPIHHSGVSSPIVTTLSLSRSIMICMSRYFFGISCTISSRQAPQGGPAGTARSQYCHHLGDPVLTVCEHVEDGVALGADAQRGAGVHADAGVDPPRTDSAAATSPQVTYSEILRPFQTERAASAIRSHCH